jgi:hypothetical protein
VGGWVGVQRVSTSQHAVYAHAATAAAAVSSSKAGQKRNALLHLAGNLGSHLWVLAELYHTFIPRYLPPCLSLCVCMPHTHHTRAANKHGSYLHPVSVACSMFEV